MPASTLHKSAQQRAPDAYIFMCKSTTQDTRAQEDARVHLLWRASKRYARRPPCARPRDTRVGLLACVQEMPASATSYARPRGHVRRPPPACAKDGRASMDACKDARVAPVARAAKMHASGRLWSFDRVVVASVLPSTF